MDIISKATRVEVITDRGREFTEYNEKSRAYLSFQDGGRTLKVFISTEDDENVVDTGTSFNEPFTILLKQYDEEILVDRDRSDLNIYEVKDMLEELLRKAGFKQDSLNSIFK